MQVLFFEGNKHIDTLKEQVAIPRQGDGIRIDEKLFRVFVVVWDYDVDTITVTLERIDE